MPELKTPGLPGDYLRSMEFENLVKRGVGSWVEDPFHVDAALDVSMENDECWRKLASLLREAESGKATSLELADWLLSCVHFHAFNAATNAYFSGLLREELESRDDFIRQAWKTGLNHSHGKR